MDIIIDTHIFLWSLSEPDKINDSKRSLIEDLSNTILVSSVSIAEIMIKDSIANRVIDFNPVTLAEESGFSLLDFDANSALLLKEMPFHHKAPFDRMLVAQSINLGYPIMTDDPKISRYDCRVL